LNRLLIIQTQLLDANTLRKTTITSYIDGHQLQKVLIIDSIQLFLWSKNIQVFQQIARVQLGKLLQIQKEVNGWELNILFACSTELSK